MALKNQPSKDSYTHGHNHVGLQNLNKSMLKVLIGKLAANWAKETFVSKHKARFRLTFNFFESGQYERQTVKPRNTAWSSNTPAAHVYTFSDFATSRRPSESRNLLGSTPPPIERPRKISNQPPSPSELLLGRTPNWQEAHLSKPLFAPAFNTHILHLAKATKKCPTADPELLMAAQAFCVSVLARSNTKIAIFSSKMKPTRNKSDLRRGDAICEKTTSDMVASAGAE